eukprot:GFYU01044195.1.p1 GENE.GFYU01044195.1~~GFYU01044195.1.p1  ORF type:complete len:140 (-),score=15.54 GFYU01044195.1:114-533(-)
MKGPSPSAAAAQDEVQHSRKLKRIQALQISPVTQLPMTLFMLWMVGNEIQIFSIMFVGMSVMNPIQSLFKTGQVFNMFEGDSSVSKDIKLGKLIYAACCIAAFVVALVKVSWMGLLPVSAMDWIDNKPPRYAELSYPTY